ncbi:MAG: UDP-N-acetylmuramoyl-tripeptide--D-alanyl-D-alanine ligase [Bacteroidales bacterium]|jgi:UDP-N-acetylmuramoyl-tripeptide--D-alanyl-D-alanine ligase|nr:UDP-N-acetylmuramoyl-tripeptide--D-alanyl-D-alanine ligase [Bacteroidales bacterium]
MKIEELYPVFLKHPAITTDSRVVKRDGLFFALKGEHFDGNAYARQAIDHGCAYAIIDNPSFKQGEQFILVRDVLTTLQLLANYHRQHLDIPVIGITGSNGKTTTKELIAAVLSKKYKITSTQGNLNNHIGVPLTLLSFLQDTNIGIVEMGANHPGEIKDLCIIAEPSHGLITNIGKAHLEGFGSVENIIRTKKELYDFVTARQGEIFYNANDKLLSGFVNELKVNSISFGDPGRSKVYGSKIPSGIFLWLKVFIESREYTLQTKLIGDYNIDNILAALAVGNYFGVDDRRMIEAIEDYKPENNRSQYIETRHNHVFLDAYNANPTSVKAAIDNFEQLKVSPKWIILGDMFELGVDAINDHLEIVQLIEKNNYEKIILVGDIFSSLTLSREILQFKNVDLLKDWLNKNAVKGSNILIKGSRGNQLEKIVEFL